MISPSPYVYAKDDGAPFKQAVKDGRTTIGAVALHSGEHQTNISKWLSGQRQLRRDRVVLMAHHLGVDLADIAEDGIRCPVCNARTGAGVAA